MDVEPQHRERVFEDIRDLLSTQVAEDGRLYQRALEVLDSYGRTNRIDGFRYWSVRDVAKHTKKLQEDLDAFARARRHQLAEWQQHSTPSVMDAATHVIEVAGEYSEPALNAAKEGIASVKNFLSEDDGEKAKEAVLSQARRIGRLWRRDDESRDEES